MKNILKNIISTTAYYLQLWPLLYLLFPYIKRKHLLVAFTFHRVIPKEKTSDFVMNYDIGQDNKNYELILNQLSKFFKIISIDEYIDFVSGTKQLTRHSALITFDDADSEFIEFALPILKANQWPAVVFAPTGYIDTDEYFWHLKISNIMLQMNNQTWQTVISNKSIFPPIIIEIIDNFPTYDRSFYYSLGRELIICLNSINDNETQIIIDQFESLINPTYTLGIKCMNWPQLQSLDKQGIAIESHTVNHHKLGHLTIDEVSSELNESKSKIETMLNKNVTAFCYPAGSHNDEVAIQVGETGYKVAFTTKPGVPAYPLKDIDAFKIPRICISGTNKIKICTEIGKILFNKKKNKICVLQNKDY